MLRAVVVGVVVVTARRQLEGADQERRHLLARHRAIGAEAGATAADRDAGFGQAIDAVLVFVAGIVSEVVA